MKLATKEIKYMLIGASAFGCGGGGSVASALSLITAVDTITLQSPTPSQFVAAQFAIGSLKDVRLVGDLHQLLQRYEAVVGRPVDGIMGGEIGPFILAMNILFCHLNNLPLIDIDAGGGRAIPTTLSDIYSVLKLERLPIVAMTDKKINVMLDCIDREIDCWLDRMHEDDNSPVIVLGYGLQGRAVHQFPQRTISKCIEVGRSMEFGPPQGFTILGTLIVEKITIETDRFSKVTLQGSGFTLVSVNEWCTVARNGVVIVTFPHLIALYHPELKICITSTDIKKGMKLVVVSKRAEKLTERNQYLTPMAFNLGKESVYIGNTK